MQTELRDAANMFGGRVNDHQAPVQAVVDALQHLERNDIRYCHWKSNVRLGKSFACRTDFDLLVARPHAGRLQTCLLELGLKRRFATAEKTFPGMEDYLGFDEATGKIFHFHVHYTLIMGRKGQKNYRLPLEHEVLDSAHRHEAYPIRVVQPALEAVIFFLRAFLKAEFNLRSVSRPLRGRSIFPRQVLDEFSALKELGPADEIVDVCRHHFAELEKVIPPFFSRRGWESDSLFTLYSIQRIVLSVLKPYRLFLGSDLKAESKIRRLAARSPRAWLQGSGLTIAFVGADGSGKSSTVGEMAKWIGWKLRVRPIYMGLPKTGITRWKRLSRVARRFGSRRLHEMLLDRYCLAVASERQRNAALAARIKGQGGIVLFDRFPLTDFWEMDKPMDGPRLNSSSRWHQHERRIYKQLEQPDHIVVLSTTDAMSIERKPELGSPPRRDALQQKIDAVDRFAAAAGDGVTVIDTSQGRDACLLEIKRVVWSLL